MCHLLFYVPAHHRERQAKPLMLKMTCKPAQPPPAHPPPEQEGIQTRGRTLQAHLDSTGEPNKTDADQPQQSATAVQMSHSSADVPQPKQIKESTQSDAKTNRGGLSEQASQPTRETGFHAPQPFQNATRPATLPVSTRGD